MPLQYLGDWKSDFDAVVVSVTSSMLNWSSLNAKIKESVSKMVSARPGIVAFANNTQNEQAKRQEAVNAFNALWDLNRRNIIDLANFTQRQYSGVALPPRIKISGGGFAGLGDMAAVVIPAIPVATAAVAGVLLVSVTTIAVYGGRVLWTLARTRELKTWASLTPGQQAGWTAPGGPGSKDKGLLEQLKEIAPWAVAGIAAVYLLPFFTRKKAE